MIPGYAPAYKGRRCPRPGNRLQRAKRKPKMTTEIKTQLINQMGRVGFALNQLMSRSKLNWNWTIEGEQLLSVQLADRLRALTLKYHESGHAEGFRGVWCHVPNEGVRSAVMNIILRAMGMLSGSFDMWFVWEGGGGIMELKYGDGELTETQEYFETWAGDTGVNKAVHRTVEGALATLEKWGAIISPKKETSPCP